MTNTRTNTSRRDRRGAARKTLAKANAASAGRTTAAVLAASGLMISTGAAGNATEPSNEDRESSTVELPISDLNVERASQDDAATVAATTDVELSFDRPVVTSESSPEPTAAEEAEAAEDEAAAEAEAQQETEAQEEAEAAAQAQAEQEAEAQQEAEAAAEAQAQQEAEAQEEAEAAAQAQAQQEAEAEQEAAAQAQEQTQTQEQTEPAQQPQSQSQDQPAQQESGQQDSGQSSQSNDGASTAGQTEQQSASNGGDNGSVVSAAHDAVGSPYSYGGTSPSGFDCSGMINWAYDQAGQGDIPRTTHGMASSLPEVSSPQPGDIVLANGNEHGGIYIGNDQVISATSSGGVRVHGLNESWHQVTSFHRPG